MIDTKDLDSYYPGYEDRNDTVVTLENDVYERLVDEYDVYFKALKDIKEILNEYQYPGKQIVEIERIIEQLEF